MHWRYCIASTCFHQPWVYCAVSVPACLSACHVNPAELFGGLEEYWRQGTEKIAEAGSSHFLLFRLSECSQPCCLLSLPAIAVMLSSRHPQSQLTRSTSRCFWPLSVCLCILPCRVVLCYRPTGWRIDHRSFVPAGIRGVDEEVGSYWYGEFTVRICFWVPHYQFIFDDGFLNSMQKPFLFLFYLLWHHLIYFLLSFWSLHYYPSSS